MTVTISVILNLIRNLCYCQKTQILTFVRMTVTDPDFRQDDGCVRMTVAISVILNLIQNQLAKS